MDSPLKIRRVPLGALHLDPANARVHGPENLEAIVASLRRFGQAEPLVVQQKTGRVIGGNGRLVAMQRLGWKECDIVEVDVDDLNATALGIALNRSASLGEWNEETLAKLLQELKAEDALDGVGYSDEDIDRLLAGIEDETPGVVDDPGPEAPPEEPVTRPGDLWLLGDHRLLCGDSTKADDLARLMQGEKAMLMATDPPYCVEYTGAERPEDSGKDWSHVYREVDIKDLGEFLRGVFRAVLPHLADSAGIYVWHAHLQYPVLDRVFEEFGILRHQPIVWVKPSSTFTYSYYRWAHEPCLFGWRKGHKPPHYLENSMTTVWEVDWEGKSRVVGNEHPIQKPLRLFEIPMEQHTRRGEVVLEPFSGSGSQLIAAEKLGRQCRAMEIAPAFVDVALRRFEKATGKKAMLEGTGRTFQEIAAERGKEVPCSTG
jgi:DNA modification methylase